jgi:hypothetical protein
MRFTLLAFALLIFNACASTAMREGSSDLPYMGPSVLVRGESGDSAAVLEVTRYVLDGWKFLYANITESEFALCLEGKRHGDRWVVTGFRLAHIIASNYNGVKYVPCTDVNYIGSAHNHPPGEYANSDGCYQSKADARTFNADGRARIDVIICGPQKFVWVVKGGPVRVWEETVALKP